MTDLPIYFAYPGDLATLSGGYHYDRRLIGELRKSGVKVNTLSLPFHSSLQDEANQSAHNTIHQLLTELPEQSVVMMDGLAFGTLDELAIKHAQRLRLVALCHHPLALETGIDASQRKALMISERRALACACATIVTSAHTRQILIDQYGVSAGKILVALPGTDSTAFATCDGNPVRFLTIGSLTQRKAHDILIDSLAQLEALPWQARFVGSSDFEPAWASNLQARVNSLGLSQRICFAGTVENPQLEYQQADVFVLPSRFEGYGMVFAEALAAGLPIIAARAGAVPDVVPKTAGLLVSPDNTEDLTKALQKVLTSGSLRRRLQTGARQAAATLPSWVDCATLVANKLKEVATS